MADATGATFSLQSFDFAGFPTNFEITFMVTGALFGGGNIFANFIPDGITDGGPAGAVDFQTFFFGPGWINLTSVTWDHSGAGTASGLFALDNIVVNESRVPEPTTLVLFGLGLAGLGLARRKKA